MCTLFSSNMSLLLMWIMKQNKNETSICYVCNSLTVSITNFECFFFIYIFGLKIPRIMIISNSGSSNNNKDTRAQCVYPRYSLVDGSYFLFFLFLVVWKTTTKNFPTQHSTHTHT